MMKFKDLKKENPNIVSKKLGELITNEVPKRVHDNLKKRDIKI